MATGNGILRRLSGKVGDLVYRVNNGRQVVSAYNPQVRNPRTEAQMVQRTKWLNVLGMYKAFAPYLREAFENKRDGQSDYNRFMSINLQAEPVYLTRSQFDTGGAVVAPYLISQGSLPPVEVTQNLTDIALGDVDAATATVAQLSMEIVRANPRFRFGDALAFFVAAQSRVEQTPQVLVYAMKITLDPADETTVASLNSTGVGIDTFDGLLQVTTSALVYAIGVVHTRRSDRLLVSTSRLTVVGSPDTILTLPDFTEAAGSLGYVGNTIFLAPDNIGLTYDDGSSDDDDEDTPGSGGGGTGGDGSGDEGNPLST